MGDIITFNNLKVGDIALVLKIYADSHALKRRIMDMGITKGVVVKVVRTAPLGDPLEVEVRGYMLSLRKEDLALIQGKLLSRKEQKEVFK